MQHCGELIPLDLALLNQAGSLVFDVWFFPLGFLIKWHQTGVRVLYSQSEIIFDSLSKVKVHQWPSKLTQMRLFLFYSIWNGQEIVTII
jgi:hypothetical protein